MAELDAKMAAEDLAEKQSGDTGAQPLSVAETPSMPVPTGPDVPAIHTPKQETIVLPSAVDTDQLAGGGNARDIKLVDNYNANRVSLSDAAKKEPSLENKDARKVPDLALLSGEVQDKLSTANDVRLRERIVKEKEPVVETPVALGVDKTAVGFSESNTRDLKGAIEGKNVATGAASQGVVFSGPEQAGLNQPGANIQPFAAAPPPVVTGNNNTRFYSANSASTASVAPTGGGMVTFQNSLPAPINLAPGGGRGGGGFGGGGAGTGQSGNQNAQVAFDGDPSLYPPKTVSAAAYAEHPRRAAPLKEIGGAPPAAAAVPQTPALPVAKPAPTAENFTFYNSGALTGRSPTLAATSSVTDESAGRQILPVRTLNTVALANTEPKDRLQIPEVTTESGQSSAKTEQNVLVQRAQTVQQNVTGAGQPKDKPVGFGGFGNFVGGAYVTNNNGPVAPSYDAETHSIIWLSDDKTADSVSNLVAQLDRSAGKAQAGAKFEFASTDAIAGGDLPLPKLAPISPSEPQPEVQVSENAFSTFSLNVSDVSFKLAAASLERGVMPDAGTVRSEEFINAFDYRDPAPAPGAAIGFAWEGAHYPFAHNRDLLRFSVKTAAAGRQPGRPLNIVLLLDNSGSMERADRVAIIHEALRVLAAQLQPQDIISVVTFARTARLWVDGIPGTQAAQVLETVSSLTPEGGTDLGDALDLAYATAKRHYLMNGVNRVVLLTDGAANLGNVNPDALKKNVEAQRKQGIDLDCFGIGWEGYNDDLLEVLTRNGDGRYGFINTPEEAASGFAAQLAGALRVAASDVKVQVEFNPARVISYRQIGYAKHQLTKEQFRDNTVNAAQIGAAESGNALYTVEVNPQGTGPVCTVRVRYRDPGTANYFEHAWDVPYTGNAVALDQASPAMRLAATASAFSEWLVSSPFAAEVTPDALLGYLHGVPEVYGADTRPAQLETMIREAKSLTGK